MRPHERDFWLRLRHLEEECARMTGTPEHLAALAARHDAGNPVLAGWITDHHDPERIARELRRIRFKAENVDVAAAAEDLRRFETAARHAEALVLYRDRRADVTRRAGESKGRDKVNRDRQDKAADRMDEVRAVYRPGMSAEDVRRAIIKTGGAAHTRRTIQRDLKKIRADEN